MDTELLPLFVLDTSAICDVLWGNPPGDAAEAISPFEVDDVENADIRFKNRFSDTFTPGPSSPLNAILNVKTETTDLSNTLTWVCLRSAEMKRKKQIWMSTSVNESKSDARTEEAKGKMLTSNISAGEHESTLPPSVWF